MFFCVGTGDGGWGRGACDHAGCFGLWETRLGRPGRSRSGLGCSSTVGAGLCPRPVFRGDGGSVGADLCVGPGTVSRGRHHGRTHRSAPTRGGRRLGTNGNWCGTMPFPAGRDGARPLRGGERRRSRRGVVTPPYGCNAGGAKRRADVGIGPYEKERKLHRPPGPAAHSGAFAPAAHSGAFAPAGVRDGWELRQRSPPKCPATSNNPSVTAKP